MPLGGKGLTLDRTLLSHIETLRKHQPGDRIEADLSKQTFTVLMERGIIDHEHRVTREGYASIQEHLQIQEYLRHKTLENLAVNQVNVMNSLMKGDASDYLNLSNGMRRKLRIYGLVERKNEGKNWTFKPTPLWKQIIKMTETS
jgi:hypothetical protein